MRRQSLRWTRRILRNASPFCSATSTRWSAEFSQQKRILFLIFVLLYARKTFAYENQSKFRIYRRIGDCESDKTNDWERWMQSFIIINLTAKCIAFLIFISSMNTFPPPLSMGWVEYLALRKKGDDLLRYGISSKKCLFFHSSRKHFNIRNTLRPYGFVQ